MVRSPVEICLGTSRSSVPCYRGGHIWPASTWHRAQAMRVCGSGDVHRRRLPCRLGKAVYWRATLPLGHATTFAAARWRRAHRGPRRGTSSCRYQCRSRRLRYRVSETSRAPCLWRPLPASLADGAGARPDHPINGHCRCGLSLRSPTIFCYDPCRTDVNSLPLGRCLFVFENKRPARSCRADHLTRKPVESFDCIIVGSGAAGAVIASRLTEDEDVKVLLPEAGGPDHHPLQNMPMAFPKVIASSNYNLRLESEP